MKRHRVEKPSDLHRMAAATAPLNTRVPGSPEWCYQIMSLLKQSYRHIHIDQDQFTHYLNELRGHQAWEKVPVDAPYGSEEKMLVGELGKRIDEIKAELDAAKQVVRKVKAGALSSAAPELLPDGGDRKSDQFRNIKIDTKQKRQDDAFYAHARLRRDRPDIHKRVLDGELSPHAGMIEAGFRKKAIRKKLTPLEKIQKLWAKLDAAGREACAEWIVKQCATCGGAASGAGGIPGCCNTCADEFARDALVEEAVP